LKKEISALETKLDFTHFEVGLGPLIDRLLLKALGIMPTPHEKQTQYISRGVLTYDVTFTKTLIFRGFLT